MSKGEFERLKKELDKLKFEVDEFCEDDLPNVGTASPGRMSAYKRACLMQENLKQIEETLTGLSPNGESMPTKSFNSQKRVEEKRIARIQGQLEEVIEQLEPDEVEEDYFRRFMEIDAHKQPRKSILKSPENLLETSSTNKSVKIGNRPSIYDHDDDDDDGDDGDDDDDDGDDGDDDDDDDDDDLGIEELEEDDEQIEEEEDEGEREVIHQVRALADFTAKEEGDLPFKKGDLLEILDVDDDGWWEGRDKDGNEGLIPNTLVQVIKDDEDEENDEEALSDGNKLRKKRSGKDLWEQLKEPKSSKDELVDEGKSSEISITEVLQAMKAVPSGFRTPTLGKWYKKEEYRASTWVIPKTSESNLQYKDLFWDPINKKLRGRNVQTCRTISFVSVKCVPPTGAGVEILSRQVYVSIWDEEKILSNIHLVRGVPNERDQSWTFTPKMAKNIPSLYDGDLVIRTDSLNRNLSLLIELNYSYNRASTGDKSDICCGWASLPLFDNAGNPTGNKNFELVVHGGTPFDHNIPLDVNLELNTSQSLMQSLIRSNRQPRMIVKTTGFNKITKETLDMLPDTFVTCQRYSSLIGYFRHHAASLFCKDDIIPSGTFFDPLLSSFPRTLDYHDLMDALTLTWNEKTRLYANRSQRRDTSYMLSLFKETFNTSVLPLLQCSQLPPFQWADAQAEKARFAFILSFLDKKDPVGNLLSPNYRFKPVNLTKMTFTNAVPYSQHPPSIGKESSI